MKYLAVILLLLSGCAQGDKGETGLHGLPGVAGGSCTVQSAVNGAVISCADGSTTVILNGTNGTDGEDGVDAVQTAYSIVGIVKPCPGSGFREVLLRLYNNQLLAHYSDGNKQFLTFLTPGNYRLTDGSSCNFTVHSDMSVTW